MTIACACGCASLLPLPTPLSGVAYAAIDLNQHGLTGSWFEPATSGQGFELEVFPDVIAQGTGYMQGSWFTFDQTTAGGAERQRWYTFGGQVQGGQPSATLSIYESTNGNFAAPPATGARVVGSVVLSFSSCSAGQLDYTFTDGTGRAGVIPLTRLTPNVTCSATAARPTNADFDLSGNWYDPATGGQGFTFEINPNAAYVFFAWYTYAPNGQGLGVAGQRWYTGGASIVPGSRVFSMDIHETTGGVFDRPTSPPPRTVKVGQATASFFNCSSGRIDYSFAGGTNAGRSGSINLSRVGPEPPGCGSQAASGMVCKVTYQYTRNGTDFDYDETQTWQVTGGPQRCPKDNNATCYPFHWTAKGKGTAIWNDGWRQLDIDSSGNDFFKVGNDKMELLNGSRLADAIGDRREVQSYAGHVTTTYAPYYEWQITDIPVAQNRVWLFERQITSIWLAPQPAPMASCAAQLVR